MSKANKKKNSNSVAHQRDNNNVERQIELSTIEKPELKRKFDLRELIPAIVLIFLEIHFFRAEIFRGVSFGDLGDGRFTALISDHWWRFFCGKERFTEIPIFYPNATSLGYSDLHLAFGLIHSGIRLFGVPLYTAFKWSCIILHAIGLFSMYFLLRKLFHMSVAYSLIGDVGYAFACAMTVCCGHPQLLAFGMMPPLLIFFIYFVNNFNDRKKRNIFAFLTIFWFVLLVYTSWYMACFTGIFCLVFMIVYAVIMSKKKARPFKQVIAWISTMGWDIVAYIVFMIILFIPFIMIYVPVMKEGSMYEYTGFYLPDPIDLINIPESNLMMGWFMKLTKINSRGRDPELWEGFSIILLGLFVYTGVDIFRKKWKKSETIDILPKSAFLSVIICLLLMIRWDGANLSLWALVYTLLIPARAVHAVARFMLWLCFPMSIVASFWADRIKLFQKGKLGSVLVYAFLALLYFSSIFINPMSGGFRADERQAFMDNISTPPQDMSVFYITDSSHEDYYWFASQLDAYEIAVVVDKPTINGYSGHFPAGWGFSDPNDENYEAYVDYWISQRGLTNVYAYDKALNIWIKR